eukprot:COSAG01_NODE_5116_length_4457_cov_5.704161_4_plen_530_part_00
MQPPPPAAPQQHEPTSEVELSIECTGLRNMDTFSKSDPMVVVRSEESPGVWREVGKTETIWDNLNPKFSTAFKVSYYFEREQNFRFECYDIDDESQRGNLAAQDFIGATAAVRLSEIVTCAGGRTVALLSREGQDLGHGRITVTAEEMSGANDDVQLSIRGEGLAALNLFGGSDPVLVLHRAAEDGRWLKVFETEPVMSDVNPRWSPISISSRKLCSNDAHRPVLLEVMDWERSGAHRPLGYFTSTLHALASAASGTRLELKHPQGPAAAGKKRVGMLVVDRCTVVSQPSFVDFLQGGACVRACVSACMRVYLGSRRTTRCCSGLLISADHRWSVAGMQINLMLAVDFTASNGDPREPRSLHHLHPSGRPNDYQRTIEQVGSILAPFDADGQLPAFGFGARFPNGQVSHCFNLNGQKSPECSGIAEVLHYYQAAVANLTLYGPTNFSEFLRMAASLARAADVSQANQEYFVLLVLTDGVITDMQDTISTIVEASSLPLSIVIVSATRPSLLPAVSSPAPNHGAGRLGVG